MGFLFGFVGGKWQERRIWGKNEKSRDAGTNLNSSGDHGRLTKPIVDYVVNVNGTNNNHKGNRICTSLRNLYVDEKIGNGEKTKTVKKIYL